jgi:hypothetical protein
VNNPKKDTPLPVTNSGARPGDFPLGSLQSRAAARAMMERKQDEEPRIFIINGNEEVPDARRQDMIVRICNVGILDDNDSVRNSSTPNRHDNGTTPQPSLPSFEAAPPRETPSVPQQEQIAIDARQNSETKPPSSTDIQHGDEEAAREARFRAYMTSRRPLVRPRPRRHRLRPYPGLFDKSTGVGRRGLGRFTVLLIDHFKLDRSSRL